MPELDILCGFEHLTRRLKEDYGRKNKDALRGMFLCNFTLTHTNSSLQELCEFSRESLLLGPPRKIMSPVRLTMHPLLTTLKGLNQPLRTINSTCTTSRRLAASLLHDTSNRWNLARCMSKREERRLSSRVDM